MRGRAGSLRGRSPRPAPPGPVPHRCRACRSGPVHRLTRSKSGTGDEFYERRASLPSRVRNPDAGWDAETARAAVEEAAKRQNDPDLPDFVRDCLIILQHLSAYLDSFHGSTGFREVLTPTERQQVGQLVSDLLDRQTER